MRTKKALLNSLSSLLLQLVSVVCGFILPRLILSAFGSEVNGAVSSIAQFLGYISLLEAGVGGVTRAALYKPLAQGDSRRISAVVNATQGFFKKIAYLFLVYTLVLACAFQTISGTGLGWSFTFFLVLILAASIFAQYYFGITYMLVLQADQKTYVTNGLQISMVVLNTILSVILLQLGCGIHTVKLASAFVYVLKPVLLNVLVRKRYGLDKSVPADYEAIRQRWDGLGHHIAFFIHNNTDVFVITMCLGLKWVSVYSVYLLIVGGVRNIVNSLAGGGEAAFGNMIAKKEYDILNERFRMIETLTSFIVISFFTATGLLLFDFVGIYTANVEDINYHVVPFGILFVISEALHCIKQTYHNLVLAAGHYKQTRCGAFVEAGLNLGLSFLFVPFFGVTGVLAATIAATFIRMLDYVRHLQKNVLCRPMRVFWKRQAINVLNAGTILALFRLFPLRRATDYTAWAFKAVPVVFLSLSVTLLYNMLFYRKDVSDIFTRVAGVITRKSKKE